MTTPHADLAHPVCNAAHSVPMSDTSISTAPLWSIQQVADFTATPVSTLYSLRSARQGPVGFRVGRSLRFRPIDVHNWIEELISVDRSAA